MRVAVLGGGSGAAAVAFDCAAHGHKVSLFDFPSFPRTVAAVSREGGIHSEGQLKGFASIEYAGHDISKALSGAQLIYVVGPAYSTRPFAEVCKPHIKPGQTIIICPGSTGGAIEFKQVVNIDMRSTDPIIAETSTLPYAVRTTGPAKIKVYLKLKAGLYLAALPATESQKCVESMKDVYPMMSLASNVFQTSLQNGNPVIHPTVTLLNAALIERTGGNMMFYEDGVTPAVGHLLKAIDQERIAIGKALGVDVIPEPKLGYIQGYMADTSYDVGYSKAPGFRGIKAQKSLNYRYFNEDVGYGMILLHDLAEQVKVETPVIDSMITIVSTVMQKNYLAEAPRTMKTLNLDGLAAEDLRKIVS